MSQHVVRRLRPQLFTRARRQLCLGQHRSVVNVRQVRQSRDVTHDFEKRVSQIESYKPREEWYPRLSSDPKTPRIALEDFCDRFEKSFESGETLVEETWNVIGRVVSIRTAGSKLVFITVEVGQKTLQIVVQLQHVEGSGASLDHLKAFTKIVRKGDHFSFVGHPHRTIKGQLSLLAAEIPVLFSPSLHQIPEKLDDAETLAKERHVDMLVHPAVIQTMKVRHLLERSMSSFFDTRGFVKVNTPMLQAEAGGAVARPFVTEAIEMQGEALSLRIAPELWLKRLVVGGMNRVFEIGPVFRNEGVDATHNPEFTICEFYAAHATLQDLTIWTEALLSEIQQSIQARSSELGALTLPKHDLEGPFARLEFIPTLEQQMGEPMPDLSSPTAVAELLEIFDSKSISVPANPSLPRLLDALCGEFIEPLCTTPTFITNHPAPLSPLSKHYVCPQTSQLISARAELYIDKREIANMYEEENSPFEQRKKFLRQKEYRGEARDEDGDGRVVDEGYLQALEWGLPPTGGWGCGIERLVAFFAGRERIGDVLSFGGLRNVVAASRGRT